MTDTPRSLEEGLPLPSRAFAPFFYKRRQSVCAVVGRQALEAMFPSLIVKGNEEEWEEAAYVALNLTLLRPDCFFDAMKRRPAFERLVGAPNTSWANEDYVFEDISVIARERFRLFLEVVVATAGTFHRMYAGDRALLNEWMQAL